MGSTPFQLSPDGFLASQMAQDPNATQAQPAPDAQGATQGPAAPSGPAASPLASLPGYNEAIAQQTADFIKQHLGGKSASDYTLEAMGLSPEQQAAREKSGGHNWLHKMGAIGQILAGRNFEQEGQQKYNAVQSQMKDALSALDTQQNAYRSAAELAQRYNAPFNAEDAKLYGQRKSDDYQFGELADRKINAMKADGSWYKLSPREQAGYIAESQGMKGITLPASLLKDQQVRASAAGVSPEMRKAWGLPDKGPVTLFKDPMTGAFKGGIAGWGGEKTGYDGDGNLVLLGADGSMTPMPGLRNPAFAVTKKTEWKSVQTTDENGNPITHYFPLTVTSQKGNGSAPSGPAAAQPAPPAALAPSAPSQQTLPGGVGAIPPTPYGAAPATLPNAPAAMAAPPARPAGIGAGVTQAAQRHGVAGSIDFVKPLTPHETMQTRMNLANTNTNLERLQRIYDNFDAVDSSAVAKAIALQTDSHNPGVMHMLLNRNITLTPKQKQLASDLISMREDINGLRGPLGATGFRGPEAFDAMVGQSGSLSTNPDVAKGVIKNTLESFRNLKTSYEGMLNRRNGNRPISGSSSSSGGPAAGAVEDGYRFKGGDPKNPSNWEQVK